MLFADTERRLFGSVLAGWDAGLTWGVGDSGPGY